jgi:cell division septation protein DedD
MLTDHDTRRERDLPHEGARWHEEDPQLRFPALEEPAWLESDVEEMEAPRDTGFRGIWIGIVAAAITFVLVFAIPQWLGWYDVGPPARAKREATPETVISSVTAKPSGSAVETPPAAATPPATATSTITRPPVAAPPAVTLPAAASAPAKPVTGGQSGPPRSAATSTPSAPKRTFTVQIAAFKDARQAARLAAKVKSDGYPADVRRVDSAAVPWVVRVGTYPTREQAESVREALARKGFRGFIL